MHDADEVSDDGVRQVTKGESLPDDLDDVQTLYAVHDADEVSDGGVIIIVTDD